MKFLSLVLFVLLAGVAHAQVPADAGLPSTGETPMPPPAPDVPVQNPKEFNQDIDDFENKISKEVPASKTPAPGATAPKGPVDKSAEKARAEMKKAHDAGGEAAAPKSGIAAHKEAMAAKKSASKKSGKAAKKSGATGKSAKGKAASAKKSAKKAPAKKKKKAGADE